MPAGRFAVFTASGDNLGNVIAALWQRIWEAEDRERIERAYSGDFEQYPSSTSVEVYVSITEESSK